MSIYHRRVFLKAKNANVLNIIREPQIQEESSTQQAASIQSSIMTQKKFGNSQSSTKSSSFNCLTQKLHNLANNQFYNIFMSVITVYTIFAIDIDKAFFNVQASTYFSIVHCAAIFLFLLQIFTLSMTKDGYFLKFYFWIDCFSTLTMFLEIIWVENLMSASSDVTVALSFAKVTKASRLSKIGARSSKIMKLIRLVKLMRFFQRQDKKIDPIIQKDIDQNKEATLKEETTFNEQGNPIQLKFSNHPKNGEDQDESSKSSSQSGGKFKEEENSDNVDYIEGSQLQRNSKIRQETNYKIQEEQQVSDRSNSEPSVQQQDYHNTYALQNQTFQSPSFNKLPKQSHPHIHHANNLSHHLSIPEENFHQYSMSQDSHQMISEDGKNNIEEIMKMFFTKNMNRFVEEGKLITTKNLQPKKQYGNMQSFFNTKQNFVKSHYHQSKTQPPLIQETQHTGSKRTRNSSRLSFIKRKQLLDLSKNRQNRERANKFNQNPINEAPFSNIVQKLEKSINLAPISRPNVDPQKQEQIEKNYQQLVKKLRQENEPKKVLTSQNLKVGQVLKEQIQKNIVVMVMGLIMVLPIIAADTWFDSDVMLNTTANLFVEDIKLIPTPEGQTELMQSFIQTGLQMSNPLQYFTIPVNQSCCQFPRQFPAYSNISLSAIDDLRLSEQTIVIDSNIRIVFSKRQTSKINAYLNLGRSLFITILLIFCSILFMKDIQNFALNPLQKMSNLINKISNNPFQALKQINEEKNKKFIESGSIEGENENKRLLIHKFQNQEDQKLETNILSNAIIKITSLLTIGAGQIGSQIISQNIDNLNQQKDHNSTDLNDTMNNIRNQQKNLGKSQIAIYVYVKFRQFETVCDVFGDQIFKYMNKVTEIVHQDTIELGGIPIEYDGNGFLLLWKPSIEIPMSPEDTLSIGENQMLAKLAILAIHSVTKIFLDVNSLEQSRKFYQHISQKNLNEVQIGSKQLFNQNYEPHMLNASLHIGQSFYGSMGSHYKLECKCIGYDVAYTRFLADITDRQAYGVGTILSEDIFLLLSEQENITKRLKIRKVDQLRLKQIRFKDKQLNPGITYMNEKQLQAIKPIKTTKTAIYTFDFSGKLEMYTSNESQLMHYSPNTVFNLNKTHQVSERSYYVDSRSVHNQFDKASKSTILNLNSLADMDDQKNQKTLTTYQERDKWTALIEIDSPTLLVTKLEAAYPHVKQARHSFDPQFYQNWSDALECYYAREITEAASEFKFLHTYNQPYYDSVAKLFLTRIENLNLEEIELEKLKSQEYSSYDDSDQDSEDDSKIDNKPKWNGIHQVVWKL